MRTNQFKSFAFIFQGQETCEYSTLTVRKTHQKILFNWKKTTKTQVGKINVIYDVFFFFLHKVIHKKRLKNK